MKELDGKVALVTGGAQNIGRAICLDLAAAGARVLVNTRRSVETAQQTVDLIKKAGGTAMVAQADITDPAAVERMVAAGSRRLWRHRHPRQQRRDPQGSAADRGDLRGLDRK